MIRGLLALLAALGVSSCPVASQAQMSTARPRAVQAVPPGPRYQIPAYLLDTLTVSGSGAYALRKLRAGYGGFAIRVQRSSDSATLDIGFNVSGNLDAATLAAFCASTTCGVMIWYDQSTSGFDVSQANTASQPTIYNSGVMETRNGLPSIDFDASMGAKLPTSSGSGSPLNNTRTVAIVVSHESGAISDLVSCSATGGFTLRLIATHIPQLQRQGGTSIANGSTALSQAALTTVLASTNGSTQSFVLNGGTPTTAAVAQLPGEFGRFAGGGNAGLSGQRASSYSTYTTIADLVSAASAARSAITEAAFALADAAASAELGYAEVLPDAVTALIDTLASACADPLDAIRLLEQLLLFVPSRPEAATMIGAALIGMLRRASIAALVRASSDYQPTSADDAAAMITRLSALIDDQATIAADAGDDTSFKALRGARGAVVADLRARGATLAQVRTVRSDRATPSLVLAERLYRDPNRAAQLVTQVSAPSPLFMPVAFQALAA